LSVDQVKHYLFHCKSELKRSNSTLNQIISAVKILRNDVLGIGAAEELKVKRPRRVSPLPSVLTKAQINDLVEVTRNCKHKAIIALLCSSGLRRNELLRLSITDIDSKEMLVHIRLGKGFKDRNTILADRTLVLLRQYFKIFNPQPKVYLFEGPTAGTPYSGSSVAKIVKKAAHLAKIEKNVTPHVLRHTFATLLLKQHTHIKEIQRLLGHQSVNTTMQYLHLMDEDPQTISPFDVP
jgi:site-specific recombinase XerD